MNLHRVLHPLAFSYSNSTLFLKDLKISQFGGNMYSCVKGVEVTTRFYFSVSDPRQVSLIFFSLLNVRKS